MCCSSCRASRAHCKLCPAAEQSCAATQAGQAGTWPAGLSNMVELRCSSCRAGMHKASCAQPPSRACAATQAEQACSAQQHNCFVLLLQQHQSMCCRSGRAGKHKASCAQQPSRAVLQLRQSRQAHGQLGSATWSSCVAAHAEQACTRQAVPSRRAEHVLQLRQSKHARLSNITALCCCFNNIRACAAGLAEQASTRQAVPSCRAELCCSSCRAGMLGSAAELLCVAASTTSEHVLQLRQSRQEHGELGSTAGPSCVAAHTELAGHTASCAQQPSRAVLLLRQSCFVLLLQQHQSMC